MPVFIPNTLRQWAVNGFLIFYRDFIIIGRSMILQVKFVSRGPIGWDGKFIIDTASFDVTVMYQYTTTHGIDMNDTT